MKMGPGSIAGIMGLFYHHFCTKKTFSFIYSVGKRSISKTDICVDWPIIALLSAYQKISRRKIGDLTSGTKSMTKYTRVYAWWVR